jgi:hypothetical protein
MEPSSLNLDIGVLVASAGMGNRSQHQVQVFPVKARRDITQNHRHILAKRSSQEQETTLSSREHTRFLRDGGEVDPRAHLAWPLRLGARVDPGIVRGSELPTEAPNQQLRSCFDGVHALCPGAEVICVRHSRVLCL